MMGTEKTIHCYNCNQVGHISRVCLNNKNRSTGACSCCEKRDVKECCQYRKVKCCKCDQKGHFSFACTEGESEGEKGRRNVRDKGGDNPEEHVMYYCLEKEGEERWDVLKVIVDTGCKATII